MNKKDEIECGHECDSCPFEGSIEFCPYERDVQVVCCVFDGLVCDCVVKMVEADMLFTGCLDRDSRGKLLYVCPRFDVDFRLVLLRLFGEGAENIFRVDAGETDSFVFFSPFVADRLVVVANAKTRSFYG